LKNDQIETDILYVQRT